MNNYIHTLRLHTLRSYIVGENIPSLEIFINNVTQLWTHHTSGKWCFVMPQQIQNPLLVDRWIINWWGNPAERNKDLQYKTF